MAPRLNHGPAQALFQCAEAIFLENAMGLAGGAYRQRQQPSGRL
jgi:hypothetical protein